VKELPEINNEIWLLRQCLFALNLGIHHSFDSISLSQRLPGRLITVAGKERVTGAGQG